MFESNQSTMASTEPILQGQILKLCDFCERETNLKWRCMQCNMCMCDNCKKIHIKVPTAAEHDIIDFNILLDDVRAPVTTDNIPCKKHQAKINCLFCRTCDTLVCPDCIYSTHKLHEFAPIAIVLQEKRGELKQKETKMLKNITYCDMKMKENKKCETKCESLLDETITKIRQKEQKLKDVITKLSQNLQNQVEDQRKINRKVFSEMKNQIDQVEKELSAKQTGMETVLKSKQGKDIFEAASEISMASNSTSKISTASNLNFDKINIKQFVNSEKSLSDLSGFFGKIQDTNLQEVQLDIGFEVMKTYSTYLSWIDRLITIDDQSAWISNDSKKVIRHINIQDDNVNTTKEISSKTYDMTITPNNDILLSEYNSSDIKLLTKTGEIKSFLSVSPLLPLGIHVTSDNVIMVGVTNGRDLYKPTDKDRRAVYVYGEDGQRQKCYEYDRSNKRLFTVPYRINTNTNNDIVVIDKTSSHTGRVVVVGREGDLKWTYNGHPTINNSKEFDPCDIVSTALGHIIVCDIYTHSLHVLSREGHILSCHVMEDMGIIYPLSLDIDRRGQLWVGCGAAKIHIDRRGQLWVGCGAAKIHIVKLLY